MKGTPMDYSTSHQQQQLLLFVFLLKLMFANSFVSVAASFHPCQHGCEITLEQVIKEVAWPFSSRSAVRLYPSLYTEN